MPGTRLEDATAIFERMRTSFAAMENPATGSLDVTSIPALDATLQTSLAS